jgi:hypothetical protein
MLELSDATTPAEAGSFACYHTSRASGVVCADDHRAPDHAGAHARRLGSSRTAHAASAARTAAAPAARARQHAPGWNAGSRAPAADADSSLLLWRPSYLPPHTSRDAHNPARLPDLHPRQIPLCSLPSGPGVAGGQRQVAAGSLSSGLQHLLALLGARQAWVADAASLLERLCLLQVGPNSLRSASEELRAVLLPQTQAAATAAQQARSLPRPQPSVPARLALNIDAVVLQCRSTGWRESKRGCVSPTRALRSRRAL